MGNDADVVSTPRDGRTVNYRNVAIGAILVLAGIGALVAGVATQLIAVGVVGFVLMLGGVILAATPTKLPAGAAQADPARPVKKPAGAAGGSFMDRMNDRWDRRTGGDR